jgi:hypothetical protein
MVAKKPGLLIAAFLLCTPCGVLAQGTGGASGGGVSSGIGTGGASGGGVSSGIGTGGVSGVTSVGTGSLGGGSVGSATTPSSAGSVVGNGTSLQGSSTVQSGNSVFQNPIGIGQNAPGAAVPAGSAQQQRNLGIGSQSSTPR